MVCHRTRLITAATTMEREQQFNYRLVGGLLQTFMMVVEEDMQGDNIYNGIH